MSNAPLVVYGNRVRWGVSLGKGLVAGDALWDGLTDAYAKTPMGMTAENLAVQYNISRQDCDEYALRSQQLWAKAHADGVFEAEMAVCEGRDKKGKPLTVDIDEHPRPQSTYDSLAKLKPVFVKDTGVVTAANASGICDGAGSIILASEQAVLEHNLTPLCRLAGYATVGCDPKIMGIGPVPAIMEALRQNNMSLSQIDRLEINEAFAAQVLACVKELSKDDANIMDKTNLHGGSIAMGHPLGASGSRLTAHLAHEFARTSGRIHVGAACIGGGQGIAVILERV
jgi:acetyl-CoA acyltransferase 2